VPQSIQYLKQLWVIASNNNENLSIRKETRCLLIIASNMMDKNRTFCEQWDGPSVNNEMDLLWTMRWTFCEQWDGPSVNKNRTFCEQWDGPFVNNEMNLLWTMRWTFCEQEQDLLWTMRWTFCEQWDKLKGPGRFTSENNFESLNWNVVLPDFLKLSVGTEYTWKFGVCKKNTTYNEIWILNFSFVFI
jgi:hypothetical protein